MTRRVRWLVIRCSERESVLFGTDRFWQGVDVPGDAPSNAIITKLAFGQTDHPLLEAQLEVVAPEDRNHFADDLVPGGIDTRAEDRAVDPVGNRPRDRGDPRLSHSDQALWPDVP